MSYSDADDARDASERGKKNQEFQELVTCVRMEINDASKFGLEHCSCNFKAETMNEFGEALVDWYQALEFEAKIEDGRLLISWENRESE